LRTSVLQTGMHKSKGKLLVDLTGNPAGPPDFDMHKLVAASTAILEPEVQGVAKKNDKGKKKMWRV